MCICTYKNNIVLANNFFSQTQKGLPKIVKNIFPTITPLKTIF